MRDMLPLPSSNVLAMDHIAKGVTGLRNLMVNVYAVSSADQGWVLIDAGLPYSAGHIKSWVERRFGSGARPNCILLTHGHFDHVGSLRELAECWDVPVYAHALELPYLTGESSYPPPDPSVGGGVLSLLSPLYPRGPIDLGGRVRAIPDDGSVPGLPDWMWIHTPGHTAGHISFFREEDWVLIAGDAFVTTRQESLAAVVGQVPVLHGPPAYYTSDWEAAELSVQRLAGLFPYTIATGHGLPLSGPSASADLEELASNFREWARPADGRYVRRPAVTGDRGVLSLPPSISSLTVPTLLVGTALTGLLWYLVTKRNPTV